MSDWALLTGATAGIGRELAEIFAAEHWNLVLVARHEAQLKQRAAELQGHHGVQCRVIAADLAVCGAAASIYDHAATLPIAGLVNNAGFGAYGKFNQIGLEPQTDMMQVNMRALVELTHLFVRPMLERKSGRILNVASTAAFQPGPTMNVYYATKAFVYSFSYALAEELAGTGVTVTTLCPGLTRTHFFRRAGLGMRTDWLAMDPRQVALAGYRGMIKGKRVVIPGALNRAMAFISKRMPPRVTGYVVKRLHQPARLSGPSTPC